MVMILELVGGKKIRAHRRAPTQPKELDTGREHRKPQDTPRMLGANGSVLDSGVGCHLQIRTLRPNVSVQAIEDKQQRNHWAQSWAREPRELEIFQKKE